MFPASPLRRFAASLALALSSVASFTTATAEHTIAEFAVPGAAQTWLWDVNNAGTMVGSYVQGTGPTDPGSGFVYDGSTITLVSGPAGAIWSAAVGISDGGKVVGSYYTTTAYDSNLGYGVFQQSHGFILSNGTYSTLDAPGAIETYPRGISPDGRYISGSYDAGDGWVGFVYDTVTATWTTIQPTAGTNVQTIAQGVNRAGVVVGSFWYRNPGTTKPGFLYDLAAATTTEQSIAGMTRTAFRAIDDAGTLAGYFVDASNVTHGFVGSVTSYETIDFSGTSQTIVHGSNNAGVLVGAFTFPPDDAGNAPVHAFIANPAVTPDKLLQQLASSVAGIGPGTSLLNKVTLAQTYFAASDIPATCAQLTDFVSQVRAQRGKKIQPTGNADQLIADAQSIMEKIGCN